MDFADRLRQKREDKGLSREKLARLIGCSASYISSIERRQEGAQNPTKDFILKASEILRISTDWLLKGEERYPDLETIQEIVSKARSIKEPPPQRPNGEVQLIPLITLNQLPTLSWKNEEPEETELKAIAGELYYDKENPPEEWHPVPPKLQGRKGVAIKVEGNSMIPEFLPGQIVWVDFDEHPMPNEYCVIEFWGKETGQVRSREVRIKRVCMVGKETITLQSVNPDPKYAEHLVIPTAAIIRIGKVVSKDY